MLGPLIHSRAHVGWATHSGLGDSDESLTVEQCAELLKLILSEELEFDEEPMISDN